MMTLYDLLGAHQADDAEALKSAFRNAVKTSHPDLHAGDPDALARFRHVVRANAILSDPDQRAIYDHLLEFERWKLGAKTRRGIVRNALRSLAADAIAVVVLAAVLTGGYLAFVHLSRTPVGVGEAVELVARGDAALAAPVVAPPDIKLSRAELHALFTGEGPAAPDDAAREEVAIPPSPAAVDIKARDDKITDDKITSDKITDDKITDDKITSDKITSDKTTDDKFTNDKITNDKIDEDKRDDVKPDQITIGDAVKVDAPAVTNTDATPASPSDPNFYRERGVAFYRSGDLDRALADFNVAIELDPHSASTYIDRSIVLYRKDKVDLAFADLAEARRIQDSLKEEPPKAAAGPRRASPARK